MQNASSQEVKSGSKMQKCKLALQLQNKFYEEILSMKQHWPAPTMAVVFKTLNFYLDLFWCHGRREQLLAAGWVKSKVNRPNGQTIRLPF